MLLWFWIRFIYACSYGVEKILNKLGKSSIEVTHSSLSDASETAADLFVVGGDCPTFVEHLPHKIILDNIMDMNELESKLKEWI